MPTATTVRSAHPAAPVPRRLAAASAVVGLVAALVIALLVPLGPRDPGPWRGDADLAARLSAALRGEHGISSMSVVELDGSAMRRADLGPVGRHHELGSITKTFNGMILADAVTRGEVRLDDHLAQHLPELGGTPVGDVTLGELAQHRGGVQELLPAESAAGALTPIRLNDPYHLTRAQVIDGARSIQITKRGEFRYSNLGAALLGHALTRAARQPDWPTLLRVRLLDPLDMRDTVIATRPDLVPADGSTGRTANGQDAEAWVTEGMAPAGTSTWTTPDDLAAYARAVLDGTAPGMEAIEPTRERRPGTGIGLHWLTTTTPRGATLWHNGGTGGARTFLGIDRAQHRAVLVLNDSTVEVDSLGEGILHGGPVKHSPFPVVPVVVLVLALAYVGTWVWRAVRGTTRVAVLGAALDAVAMLVAAYRLGPWAWLTGWAYAVLVGASVAAAVAAAGRWGRLPWRGAHPRRAAAMLVVRALFCALVAWLVLVG